MALYHDATVTPTKTDLLKSWVPTQPWCPPGDVEVIGAFRFDDPEGSVGMETHLVSCGGTVLHVPLTYRDAPRQSDAGFITEMHHTALGTRWVYDGLADDRYLVMAAAVTMTGQGEALGMVQYDGTWFIAPAAVRIRGGNWSGGRVSVDNLEPVDSDVAAPRFRNERFELTVHRHAQSTASSPLALTARWAENGEVVLAAVSDLAGD